MNSRITWAVFGALLVVSACDSASAKVNAAVWTCVIFYLADFLERPFKKYWLPAFRLPFLLIVVLTFIEAVNLKFTFSNDPVPPLAAIPVLLIGFSSPKFSERMETSAFFLILVLLAAGIQEVGRSSAANFYPVLFVALAFGVIFLERVMLITGRRSR